MIMEVCVCVSAQTGCVSYDNLSEDDIIAWLKLGLLKTKSTNSTAQWFWGDIAAFIYGTME